jgi:hypothetical protein
MLWGDDGFDDVGDIVYIRKGLDAEEDVVKGLFGGMGGVFGGSDDSIGLEPLIAVECGFE